MEAQQHADPELPVGYCGWGNRYIGVVEAQHVHVQPGTSRIRTQDVGGGGWDIQRSHGCVLSCWRLWRHEDVV
jgi:hypothetical protein